MKNLNATFPNILALNPEFARPRTHRVRARSRSFARLMSDLFELENTPAGIAERSIFAILAVSIVVPVVAAIASMAA